MATPVATPVVAPEEPLTKLHTTTSLENIAKGSLFDTVEAFVNMEACKDMIPHETARFLSYTFAMYHEKAKKVVLPIIGTFPGDEVIYPIYVSLRGARNWREVYLGLTAYSIKNMNAIEIQENFEGIIRQILNTETFPTEDIPEINKALHKYYKLHFLELIRTASRTLSQEQLIGTLDAICKAAE